MTIHTVFRCTRTHPRRYYDVTVCYQPELYFSSNFAWIGLTRGLFFVAFLKGSF